MRIQASLDAFIRKDFIRSTRYDILWLWQCKRAIRREVYNVLS